MDTKVRASSTSTPENRPPMASSQADGSVNRVAGVSPGTKKRWGVVTSTRVRVPLLSDAHRVPNRVRE